MVSFRAGAAFLLLVAVGACATSTQDVQQVNPNGELAPAVFRDEFLRFEFQPPGVLERFPTVDENSTVFVVDGKRKLSFIRRYSAFTYEDFVKDFENRVLAPMEISGQAERFEISDVSYREENARMYGLRSKGKPSGENETSFIMLSQRGHTFMITALEGYREAEQEEIFAKAQLLASTQKVDDNARLFSDVEAEALKACKRIVKMGFGSMRHEVAGILRTCIGLHPYFDAYYSSLAEALRLAGREGEALRVLDEGLAVFANNATLINNQAWYLLTFEDRNLRDYGRALELSKKAVELTKRQAPALLHTLAQAYVEMGEIIEAMNVLEECKRLSPNDMETLKSIRELELRILRMKI